MGAERWRYLDCGAVTPFENAAVMPVLGREVAAGDGPIAMTSVWGQTHLNVGWFDDVDDTLYLDKCRELGIEVIRRPLYGGGTAFYDAGCALMWGFLLPKEQYPDLDNELARFQPVLLQALDAIGLGDAAEVPQEIQHRQIGESVAVRQAAPFQRGHALPGEALAELIQQPGLPHAGLPDKPDHLPATLLHLCEQLLQHGELPLPPHERTQHSRSHPCQWCVR